MQLEVTGHQVDPTDALRSYVEEQRERLERQRAEATAEIEGGGLLADARSSGLHAAIDLLVDELDRRIPQHEEQVFDRSRRAPVRR